MKLSALLNVIGSESIEVLKSVVEGGLNSQDTDAYDAALIHLKNYYDYGENEHVAWIKATTLLQPCGENDFKAFVTVGEA